MITLWLKQALSWFHTEQTESKVDSIKELTDREQGIILLSELNQHIHNSFRSDVAGLVQFKCSRSNIISLTELIIELNKALKEGAILSASRCYFTDEVVTVNSFFEKDGRYISHSSVQNYCKALEEFYNLTEACDKATVGIHEHNKRMLTRIFVNLKDVSAGLLEVFTYED